MKTFFFVFSIIGWILSVLTLILSHFEINVNKYFPFTLVLFIAVFVVWIPCVWYGNERDTDETIKFKKIVTEPFRIIPLWLTIIAIISSVYAWSFGIKSFTEHQGATGIINSRHVLHDNNRIIKYLTEEEYNREVIKENHLSLLFPVAFYSIAASIMYYNRHKRAHRRTYAEDNNL